MHDSRQISRGNNRSLIGAGSMASPSGAALVLTLGIIGQLVDSRVAAGHQASLEIHVLFGILLCAAIFTHFYTVAGRSALDTPRDLARLSRSLSRKIYLLMYLLLGLRIILELGAATLLPPEGFRDYLIAGILALGLTRVLAVRRLRGASLHVPRVTAAR